MGPRPAAARPRRPAWRWAPVVVVVLLVALVAVTGGFARAVGTGPRTFAVGQAVELRRWAVTVDGVDLTNTDDDSPDPPKLRVRLRVTFTGDASEDALPTGLVTVVVPGGPGAGEVHDDGADGYAGAYDPDVERPTELELVWPDGADENAPRRAAPTTVQVVLHDERPAQNYLFAGEWVTTGPVGHVDVPVVDRRTG